MTEKRYFKREWEEEYYIFDSQVISEKEFDEKVEYEGYRAFEDCMHGDDVINRMNKLHEENTELDSENTNLIIDNKELKCTNVELAKKNEQLKEENKELKELVREVDNELEIRDTVCRAGKFRLEEWGKHRYHQFYKGDEELEDESVVIMLMESEKENKELKEQLKDCTKKAKEEIRKQVENDAIIWANIGR